MRPLFTTIDELNSQFELFYDPERKMSDNTWPFIIVCDDFYPDAMTIRRIALAQTFFHYKPPLAEQAGEKIAAEYNDLKYEYSMNGRTGVLFAFFYTSEELL